MGSANAEGTGPGVGTRWHVQLLAVPAGQETTMHVLSCQKKHELLGRLYNILSLFIFKLPFLICRFFCVYFAYSAGSHTKKWVSP